MTLSKVVQRCCKLVVQCCCKVADFSMARYAAKVVQCCCKVVVQLRVQIDRADGCTSGHGISGTLQLAVSSWISAICFFMGGILTAHIIFTFSG